MNFLKKILPVKDSTSITNYATFWKWFMRNEQSFYQIVRTQDDVDANFLSKLFPKLQSLNHQFYCLTGMYDQETAELVITTESDIKTFVFVEDLVAAAPVIKNWRFTALTPPTGFHDTNIDMDGYRFDTSKIKFISNESAEYPDETSLTLIHSDFNEANKDIITRGISLYLDNALGELNAATLIDHIEVKGFADQGPQPIPIEKLRDFLLWKEKEFVEKYDGVRCDTENDTYSGLEAKDKSGLPIIAIINQELLNWDAKASHPWMMTIDIKYARGSNGMPDKNTSPLLDQFEDDLLARLPDTAGYLNLGRKTYNSTRTIYFACKEFSNVSKNVHLLVLTYEKKLDISYDIYKDKYWMTMNQFKQS